MKENIYSTIGEKLRASRKAKGVTLTELSDNLNKSISTISKYENGAINIPIDFLIDVCKFLNISISEILPETFHDNTNADVLKYESSFIDKLHIYWYNGGLKRIRAGVIENTNLSMKSTLYLGTENSDPLNYYESEFIYHGTISYSDSNTVYYYTNINPPFDKVFISLPSMIKNNDPRIGIMSCVTYYYQFGTVKVMATNKPVSNPSSLKDDLILSAADIKAMKRTNLFIV